MKSYTESKKKKPFDWNEFLDRAIAGDVTDKEIEKAAELSSRWVSCACGTQCSVLDRDKDGEPIDRILHELGMDFYDCIEEAGCTEYSWARIKFFKNAKTILNKIEKRSTILIDKKLSESIKVLNALGYTVTAP